MKADEFRAELAARGLNQRQLADHLGVDYRTVNRWATGKLDVPQYVVAYFEALSGKTPWQIAIKEEYHRRLREPMPVPQAARK